MEVEKKKEIKKSVGTDMSRKVWLSTYIFFALGFLALYILTRTGVLDVFGDSKLWLEKLALAGFFAVLVLCLSKFLEMIIVRRPETKYKRYNFIRLTRLIGFIAAIFLCTSFLFANWYAAAVSLGLISLILGFALQTPISSLIGWMYIIIRNPYRIGDRVQIGEYTGDVVEIGYLDTTLWEFAGHYLTSDLPSGRLIRFPNSLVLEKGVYNYSWKNFEYIWNEIPFHVAYESDLEHIETVIRKIMLEELGEKMAEKIEELKALIKSSPLDPDIIKAYPLITFRTHTNTWLEVTVTYLVPPKKAALIRTAIIKKLLAELMKEPEKVMFPKSNLR